MKSVRLPYEKHYKPMNDSNINPKNEIPAKKKQNPWLKGLAVTGIVICSIVVLLIAAAVGLTLYLTPERLARLINEHASEYVDADVHVGKVDYTIWSSFPYLSLEIDTLRVTPDNVPAELRRVMPSDYNTLMYLTKLKGGINVRKLIYKELELESVSAEGLRVNLAQLNDSLNNYSIIPPDELEKLKKFKLSGFTASSVVLPEPSNISFFSVKPEVNANVTLKSLHLVRQNTEKDMYHLYLDGNTTASMDSIEFLNGFPFSLGGNIFLADDLSGAALDNFNVNLGDMFAKIDISATIKDRISIDNLSYSIPGLDISSVLALLPETMRDKLPDMDFDLILSSSGRLDRPYNVGSGNLPEFSANIACDNGSLKYIPAKGKALNISKLGLDADIIVNGSNPNGSSIDIKRLEGEANGFKLSAKALAMNLLGEATNVDASVKLNGNLSGISGIAPLRQFGLKGNVDGIADLSIIVNDLTGNPSLSDANLEAVADIKQLTLSPKYRMALNANGGVAKLEGKVSGIDKDGLKDGLFSFDMSLRNAGVRSDSLIASAKNVKIKGSNSSPLTLSFSKLPSSLPPMNVNLSSSAAAVAIPQEKININAKKVTGKISTDGKNGKSNITIGSISMKEKDLNLNVQNVAANMVVKPVKQPVSNKKVSKVASIIDKYSLTARVKTESGTLRTPAFPSDNTFRKLDLAVTPDTVNLNNLWLHSGGCGITLKGKVSDVRKFLADRSNGRLKVRMDMDIDTLDINRLARVYENGVAATDGKAATLPSPKPMHASHSDSVTMAIPKFIDAELNASANHLVYTDLDLTDISTLISVKNGVAKLSDLELHAPFADADINVVYSTEDLDDIFLAFDADLSDVDITSFFECYRNTLLKAMPYMSNLSGILSVQANGKITLFPTNYLDIPSLTANLEFQGRDLKIHQSKFIHRIARLMLIRHKGDLLIHNMDISANIHDNLVELDPFLFEMDRYKFVSGGTNNFDGDMFYHIGVQHSPIPFPFGVNILGSFNHPRIRFGGVGLKPSDSEKVSSQIMENHEINLPMNLKYYFIEFIKKASEDYEGPTKNI